LEDQGIDPFEEGDGDVEDEGDEDFEDESDEDLDDEFEEVLSERFKDTVPFVPDAADYGDTPFRRSSPKIGRNEPCPCGSGKKHKKCCGKKT
jgi:SEC-C motif-containing protein